MKFSRNISFRKTAKPLMVAFAFTYLGFHLMNGERGIYSLFKENNKQKILTEELQQVSAKRQNTEIKVTHMRNGSLDLDLLDEQARRMLGTMNEGEKMILLESN